MSLTFVSLGLAVFGSFMLAHGTGLLSAEWLHPNPDTPAWVFAAIGLILLLASVLAFAQVRPMAASLFNATGWGALAVGWLLAHWLLFFAKGASCEIGFLGLGLLSPNAICMGIGGTILGLFDLAFIAIAGKYLWQRRT
jgi:hypothetical protein